MTQLRKQNIMSAFARQLVAIVLIVFTASGTTFAQEGSAYFLPGNLVVSRSVYDNNPNNIAVGATLPPNCISACGAALNNGTYPFVWNNDVADSSFGITSKILLDQMTPSGLLINSLDATAAGSRRPGGSTRRRRTSLPRRRSRSAATRGSPGSAGRAS